jgi:hypothetical protein
MPKSRLALLPTCLAVCGAGLQAPAGGCGSRRWTRSAKEGRPSSPANVSPSYEGHFEGDWHR